MRAARWVIADMRGKRNRMRTVPMPSWAKASIHQWATVAGISTGRIFCRLNKGDRVTADHISDEGIADVVHTHVPEEVAAHDLRRSFAKLAYKG